MDQAAKEAILTEYDFIVAIDASGSMSEADMPGGRSRWDYMQESLTSFARDLGKIDSDGIDVVLFGGTVSSFTGVTAEKCKEIFATRSPRGSTPLAEALTEALKLAGKSAKKDFIVVFTDGVPDDGAKVAQTILDQANKQKTDDELSLLFVQVGRDASATKYLGWLQHPAPKGRALSFNGRSHSDSRVRRHVRRPTEVRGAHVLRMKENHDCFYLGPEGCTIHDRAPYMCRIFDCREQHRMYTRAQREDLVKQGLLSKDVLRRGAILIHRAGK